MKNLIEYHDSEEHKYYKCTGCGTMFVESYLRDHKVDECPNCNLEIGGWTGK